MSRALTRGRLAVLALAALALVLPSVAQLAPVRAQLTSAGLLPQSQAFTQLSIKQFATLYKTVSYEGDVRFDAVATNTSTHVARYTWSATVGPGTKPIVVDRGRLVLRPGATTEIPLHFTIPDCRLRNRISVQLHAAGQRSPVVHYWVLPHDSAAFRQSGGPSCAA